MAVLGYLKTFERMELKTRVEAVELTEPQALKLYKSDVVEQSYGR